MCFCVCVFVLLTATRFQYKQNNVCSSLKCVCLCRSKMLNRFFLRLRARVLALSSLKENARQRHRPISNNCRLVSPRHRASLSVSRESRGRRHNSHLTLACCFRRAPGPRSTHTVCVYVLASSPRVAALLSPQSSHRLRK